MSIDSSPQRFTETQGQYLAFIYYYDLVNRRPPAEADIQAFFGVTPPTVHRMVIELERRGLISRTPRQARSISSSALWKRSRFSRTGTSKAAKRSERKP